MLIVMDSAATADDVQRVVEAVQSLGFQAHPIPGAQRTAISVTGNRGSVESASFENLPGVAEVIPVTAPYKLGSREAKGQEDRPREGRLRRDPRHLGVARPGPAYIPCPKSYLVRYYGAQPRHLRKARPDPRRTPPFRQRQTPR